MASRLFKPVRGLIFEHIILAGSFAPAGTGAPTDTKGKGFTVSRTDVGEFAVVLDDKYADLESIGGCTLQLATPDGSKVVPGAWDASAKTLVLQVLDATALAADISANANNRVHFVLHMRNRSFS